MASLLESINTTREETIATHYGAAVAELQAKVKEEPLKTTFHIYAGCVSRKITDEIAHRFDAGGLKAVVETSGLISSSYYLTVDVSLPENLVHAKKEEEKKEEEKKEEEKKEEEKKEEEKKEEEGEKEEEKKEEEGEKKEEESVSAQL